jgi:hypothetical protein
MNTLIMFGAKVIKTQKTSAEKPEILNEDNATRVAR